MAIQGTQVPMYTKHTLFLYFSDFPFFIFIFMKNKIKQNQKKKKLLNHLEPFSFHTLEEPFRLANLDLVVRGKSLNHSSSKGT